MNKTYPVLSVLLIAAAVVATVFCYSVLPGTVPVHWDAAGEVNGYAPRWRVWAFGPGMMAGWLLLAQVMPRVSPQRFGVEGFRRTYDYLVFVVLGMLAYLYAVMLLAMLSEVVNMRSAVPAGLFLLLILIGNPLGKVKRNFFIGVRTPWTLTSERVWYATHRLAAKLMVASGVVGLAVVMFGHAPAWVVTVLSCGWALVAVLFSLVYYKRLERDGRLDGV